MMVRLHHHDQQQQQQQRLLRRCCTKLSSNGLSWTTMLVVVSLLLLSLQQQLLLLVEGTTTIVTSSSISSSVSSSLLRIRNNTMSSSILPQQQHQQSHNQQHTQHTQQRQRQLSPSIGSFRMLVLLVQFTDHTNSDRNLPPKSHFEDLCTNHWIPYFQQQSYSLYTISGCDVYDWIQTDNTESFYSYNNGNLVGSDMASSFFLPVLRQVDNNGIDFTQYDIDLDLTIDSLLIIHSGYASEQGSGSACNANPPQNRIVSQGHVSSNPSVWTSNNGLYNINGYAIASAFDRVCPTTATWSSWGVAAHEKTHTFNTPDIYDLATRTSSTSGFLGGTGLYDIMSNPFGPASDGNAGGMSSFIKEITGWVQPIEILYDGIYTIRALNDYGDVYKITKGYGTDEYILIENRYNTGYDSGLPGSGLLIYHIDKAIEKQDRAGFPSQSGWPTNGNHYRCAVLQADGKYDLEQGVNNGDAGDYWTQGMTLGPGNNGQTYPNTDSYQNGNIVSTGITITDISASGPSMTFRVSGLGADPNGGGTVTVPTSPGTSPPVTSPPVTSPPMTSPPTTPSPITSPPTTPSPTTLPPTTPSPTTSKPIMPTTSYPTTTQPVVTAPPATFPPTPLGNAVVVDDVATISPTQESTNGGGSASLSDLSFIPSSIPSQVPISTKTIKPSFFSANIEQQSTNTSSSSSLLLLPLTTCYWYLSTTLLVITITTVFVTSTI